MAAAEDLVGVGSSSLQADLLNTVGAHRNFYREGHGLEDMASTYNRVWGQSPQLGPGAELLVRVSGDKAPLNLKALKCLHT